MTLVVSQIIDETRRILADNGVADKQRNTDAAIRSAMRMSLSDFRRLRPDLFIGALDALPDITVVDTLDIEDWLFSAFAFLTTGYVLLQNDQFSQDGTASNLINAGKAQLVSPGGKSGLPE